MNALNKISMLHLDRWSSACALLRTSYRSFSASSKLAHQEHYKLLIVGGGTGGLSTGSKFARELGKGSVALVDKAEWHCRYPISCFS